MQFDPNSKHFFLKYIISTTPTANTEIYLNQKWHYPTGFDVTITPSNAASWKQIKTNRIQIIHSQGARTGDTLVVEISTSK